MRISLLLRRLQRAKAVVLWRVSRIGVSTPVILREYRLRFRRFWHAMHPMRRGGYLFLAFLLSFSILFETYAYVPVSATSQITGKIDSLLPDAVNKYAGFIDYDALEQQFYFNRDYKPSSTTLGTSGSPQYSATFPLFGSDGNTVVDPVSGADITITPTFTVGRATRDMNRLVYPLPGRDAIKVISLGGAGYKEDIVLNSFQGDRLKFSYELGIPDGIEARIEEDGSVGFYGVRNEILGDVTAATEADAELLRQAQLNGAKDNLLFKMPAPYVVEHNKSSTDADVYFVLNGNTLTTVADNLRGASYPLSIDPSVYVETARKFMRGNNETNVDFEVDSQLIQKASTTGARFDDWVATQSLDTGLYDGATATAGGYIYHTGGIPGTGGGANTTEYTAVGADTYVVPAGVTSVTIKAWGAGGGGGGGADSFVGAAGGGGAYVTSTIAVTPSETLDITVGGGGGGGTHTGFTGSGGGGGGLSSVYRSTTALVLAAGGGGGGGGGDNENGGAGAGGGDETNGFTGGASDVSTGGAGATPTVGGAGGTSPATPDNDGSSGGSLSGGEGGNGSIGGTGQAANGGTNGGGDGGGDTGTDWAGGGGGGGGLFGGGGGAGADNTSGNGSGGAGGGSGVSDFVTGSSSAGSGTTPGNSGDGDRGGAADGGTGGGTGAAGTAGDAGKVVVSYSTGSVDPVETVQWIDTEDVTGNLVSPTPGNNGVCTGWCSETSYDLPEERRGHTMVAYNGFLYVIGGEDGTGTKKDTIFIAKLGANGEPSLWHPTDTNPDNWVYWYSDTVLADTISYSAAVAYNNRLYLVGGSTGASPGGSTTVQYTELNPTGTLAGFTTVGTVALSTPRFQHSLETYNGFLYVLGGDSNTSGALLNTVEYVKLADDGALDGSWEAAASFATPRRTNGGDFATIYGAYLYIAGGCTNVSGGNCQTVGTDIQISSLFANGNIGEWSDMSNASNQRVGYGLVAWQNYIYRIGGCTAIVTSGNDCTTSLSGVDKGQVNPPGEVSTVNITEANGVGSCSGATPINCDLPPAGDSAGQGGQLLVGSAVLNSHLYVIGGCASPDCINNSNNGAMSNDAVSGNVSYASIGSDGSLGQPTDCVANGNTLYGAWCIDSTNRINSTTGVAAAGVTTFNDRIYVVGGLTGAGNSTNLYYNSVNSDGSLAGGWTAQDLTSIGAEDVAYNYAFTRANPNQASTAPGNLYMLGGCTATNGAGCSVNGADRYSTGVYKCNIAPGGAVSGCTTAGQLQIDSNTAEPGNQGIGAHAGTLYANRLYLIGGLYEEISPGQLTDRDQTIYAEIDDNNNIVAASGNTTWVEDPNVLSAPRRRGSGFGYNGHLYAVGGFDDSDGGVEGEIISFIEWSKLSVSTGGLDPYVTSSIEINQRWGLNMVVSNSFAYVLGGCDMGDSPGECTSFEESVQTFQLYNNDSGAAAEYVESTGDFATNNDRVGSSAAILDGYIYVAGGETAGTINAASTTVQFAKLNADGSIGAWADTTASLPAARAYGELEAAGGSLYYIGGEDNAGDEKSEVYHATPSSGTSVPDVIRTTTYSITGAEFTGTTYTLSLDEALTSDYFTIIAGADDLGGTNGPDSQQVRIDGDPYGNLGTTTGGSELLLRRGSADNNWVGTVTVVECVSSCSTDGFELADVMDLSLASGNTLTDVDISSSGVLPAGNHTSNTVPFGGFMGGGLSTAETSQNNFSATAGVRLRKNGTDQIRIERQTAGTAGTAAAADVTIYVVEWGSAWNVQEANFDDWNVGAGGVNATGEYTTQAITSVARDNAWVWKSPGTSEDNGLGDGAFGKVLTLGDGVNQNASETTVALGSRHQGGDDVRDDTVYVLEHADLAVDYQFATESNKGSAFTTTVDAAIVSEANSTLGNVTTSAGYRIPLIYHSDSGTGTAYSRVAAWAQYFGNATTINHSKSYTGNSQAAWIQSVDFGANAGTDGVVDITTWSTATTGLPGDRTRFGAAVWNDRLFVTGGLDDSGSPTNTIYISPQQSNGGDIVGAWTTESAANEFDVERSGLSAIAYANNLYILGGNDGSNYLSDVQFTQINSDGTLDPWTFTTSLPRYVSDADGFAANGFMYLLGGGSTPTSCSDTTFVAPISANTTIATGNNPTGIGEWYETNIRYGGERIHPAVAYNDGTVYVSGGGCQPAGTISSTTYTFDSDGDADETAWSFVSDNGSNGLNGPNTARAWSHDTNDTTSANVGPTSGQGGDPDGYVYTEATSPAAAGDTFHMTRNAVIDASNLNWTIDFYWNQRGDDNTAVVNLQTNENGAGWVTRGTFGGGDQASGATQVWNFASVDLAGVVSDASTQVRFLVTLGSTGDIWNNDFGLDTITFTNETIEPISELTTDQHYYGTLRAQPQVARYSYFVDADSDVFPTSWLLNGVDNDIGARWQWAYRSSTDASNAYGVDTDFGDVTLGQVEDYIPRDGAGSNTDFARYFYVTVSIDASRTFGYPDDVSRGPTVEDMTIFFISDPSKRLRHGKTFIQGVEQPLDTPPLYKISQLSPKIWLDAQDIDGDGDPTNQPLEGATVTAWTDKSSNVNDPTLNSVTYDAVEKAIRVPAAGGVQFDGSSISTGTIFAVVQKDSTGDTNGRIIQATAGNYLLGHWGTNGDAIYIDGNPSAFNSAPANGGANLEQHVYTYDFPVSTTVDFRKNGTSILNDTTANSVAGVTWGTNSFGGTNEDTDHFIKEFIVFDTILTDNEKSFVETYLQNKWNF